MKIIVDARPWDKELITASLEAGVNTFILDEGKVDLAHKLGKCVVISVDGDITLGKEIIEVVIGNKDDEDKAVGTGKDLIVSADDWKIIPLENLVSRAGKVYARGTVDEIKMMEGILEKGVEGMVITPKSASEVKKAVDALSKEGMRIPLVEATVTKIKDLGKGERSCIDTCTMIGEGRGMLVGNTSNFMFLVHAESVESEYCATRPFRVNAGGIHAYGLLAGDKTKYLAEISPGDSVLIVDREGNSKEAIVGRNKIEERSLILVEAKADGKTSGLILQNAETIRLVTLKGHRSITELKIGDKVLVRLDDTGRHFGKRIEEKIKE